MAVVIVNDSPEDDLADHLTYAGIAFERQFRAFRTRQFKVDFYIPAARLIVEVDGGIYSYKPSHTSAKGIVRDMEKTNLATLYGYRLLRFTGQQVESGEALTTIEQVVQNVLQTGEREGIQHVD